MGRRSFQLRHFSAALRYLNSMHRWAVNGVEGIVTTHWLTILAVQTALLMSIMALPNLLLPGRPKLGHDSYFYLHSGWRWTRGYVPYIHTWDVKPPFMHELSALFSLLVAGDPYWLATLAIVATAATVIGIVMLVGTLVHIHTENPVAAYAAGTTVLAYPILYTLAAKGVRPKYYVMFLGLCGVWLATRQRYGAGGASAAAAAWTWQFGAVFPLIILGGAFRRWLEHGDPSAVRRTVLGAGALSALVLAPIALGGALVAMLGQTLLASFLTSEPLTLTDRIARFFAVTDMAAPLALCGLVGSATPLVSSRDDTRALWIPAGTVWFCFQVFYLDFQSGADLLLLWVFIALGVGLLVARTDARWFGLLVVCATATAQFGVLVATDGLIQPATGTFPVGSMRWYYWTQAIPETCHFRGSPQERAVVRALDAATMGDRTCEYDIGAYLRAVFN